MSYKVPDSPEAFNHPDSDQESFHSFSSSDISGINKHTMAEINENSPQLVNQSLPSSRLPKLLPPHLWNLPYITLSPEILEAASSIDGERVSQLFAASAPSTTINSPAPAAPFIRPRLPVQPITPFDGSPVNLRPFCSQLVNQIQGESFVSETEKVRFAYQCLGPGALAKMRSSSHCLVDSTIRPEITTIDEFLAALKQRCEDPSLRDQATTRVERSHQGAMKFHDFITYFEDNMVDSIYSTVDKSHWRLMLERKLSPQLRNLILSASDVPEEYHAFVAYLRRKDAGLQDIMATSGIGLSRSPYFTGAPPLAARPPPPPTRPELQPLSSSLPVSQGGSAMDLDLISRERLPDGHLTEQAKAARKQLGRCIRCNKLGHMVRSCPLGSKTSSLAAADVTCVERSEELKD